MPVKNRLAELHDDITAWRRDLHENPEILYDLPRTAALAATVACTAQRATIERRSLLGGRPSRYPDHGWYHTVPARRVAGTAPPGLVQ